MKTMRRALLAAALAMAVSAPSAAQVAPMPIYQNDLAPGWNNWSWANVELGITIADPAERPISVRAEGWQALYFQHAPFSTAGYSTLSFFAHGGARGGQVIQVMAVDAAGEALPNTYQRVTLTANEWTQVDMPLSAIGAENTTVSGFWIQNGSADPTPRFLVNEVVLR